MLILLTRCVNLAGTIFNAVINEYVTGKVTIVNFPYQIWRISGGGGRGLNAWLSESFKCILFLNTDVSKRKKLFGMNHWLMLGVFFNEFHCISLHVIFDCRIGITCRPCASRGFVYHLRPNLWLVYWRVFWKWKVCVCKWTYFRYIPFENYRKGWVN